MKINILSTPSGSNNFMDEVMSFLETSPTAKEILAFQPSVSLRDRSAYLSTRNQAGTLTVEEKRELDDILRVNHFVNMLKIRTRQKLGDTQKE